MKAKIPYVEHRSYDVTFLQRVILKLNFNASIEDSFDVLRKFFLENFQLDFDEEKYDLLKVKFLRISGNDGIIIFKFAKDFIQIKVERNAYQGFKKTMEPYLDKIIALIDDLSGSVAKLAIKKVNMWPADIDESVDYYNLLEHLFKQELTSKLPISKPDGENVKQITECGSGGAYNIVLSFGYLPKSDNRTWPTALLDIEGICDNGDLLTDRKRILDVATDINQDIFNVYHWAVTDEVINVMETKLK